MDRTVGAELGITADGECQVELQLAVARTPGLQVTEKLSIVHEGSGELVPVEVAAPHDGRIHLVTLPPGTSRVTYEAQVRGTAEIPEPTPYDLSLYRRPSRYIESDGFGGFAAAEFAGLATTRSSSRPSRPGSAPASRTCRAAAVPPDGATETLLSGAGVCRDYAHLVIALLRALRVPARLAAVYAPGCDPMDFHAVAEAFVAGGWYVVDATALAPRSSLVRIGTGRDASDVGVHDHRGRPRRPRLVRGDRHRRRRPARRRPRPAGRDPMRFTEHELTAALTGAAKSVFAAQDRSVRKGKRSVDEAWAALTPYARFKLLDGLGDQLLPVLVALPDVEVETGTRPTFTDEQVTAASRSGSATRPGTQGGAGQGAGRAHPARARAVPPRSDPDALIVPDHL